jgi:hypothetical protein
VANLIWELNRELGEQGVPYQRVKVTLVDDDANYNYHGIEGGGQAVGDNKGQEAVFLFPFLSLSLSLSLLSCSLYDDC